MKQTIQINQQQIGEMQMQINHVEEDKNLVTQQFNKEK